MFNPAAQPSPSTKTMKHKKNYFPINVLEITRATKRKSAMIKVALDDELAGRILEQMAGAEKTIYSICLMVVDK